KPCNGFEFVVWPVTPVSIMPTGSPINNVVANIFLVELDKKIDKHKNNSCYFRYGDDILLATHDKVTAEHIGKILSDFILDSALIFNEEKVADITFDATSKREERFKYLGLMVTAAGKMRLTAEKDKEIKLNIKNMINKMDKMFDKITKNKPEKVDNIVICSKILLFKTPLYPWLLSYFPVVNDEDYWKELDLWIAKTILARIYKKTGDRVFANYSFKKLRNHGLPSLLHLRRLYLDDKDRFFKYLIK
ncbi:MAG: reverse transcriptase domain-containing protein, partial [bacterium]